jgi:ketosteroid isomerase-like protein
MGSVDIEAEKKVIISLIKRTFDAEERKDIETKMQYYDEDFVWLGENRPIVKDWDYLDVSLSGDMAYGYGNAETTMQGPEGEVKSYSKGLSVFKKRDGVWRCVAASTTSNSPQE